MNLPPTLKYSKSHEWVLLEGDVATIGITDHAQSELGDVVYVDLPEVGRTLVLDEVFGSIESVKTVSDLYSPLSGEVVEVNPTLNAEAEKVNGDPYGGGWLVKIKLSSPEEWDELLGAEAYAAIIQE